MPSQFLVLLVLVSFIVGLSYDEADYGRSSWFVDLSDDVKEKRPERSVSSGHLVTLDEPDLSNWLADDGSQAQIPLGMHNATFETRFGGLAVNELSIDMPPNKKLVLVQYMCSCRFI